MLNKNNYIIKDIPKFNPFSIDRINFWREQKQRALYGMWSAGYWMPGLLYHYLNMWHIELKENEDSKNATIGRPWYRDTDYDFAVGYTEARGFSRFENQSKEEVAGMHPRQIMTAFYNKPMGKPLFENPAKNIILVTSRGLGKSFNVAHAIGYEWLHSPKKGDKKQCVVGASEAKYSSDLLAKVKIGIDHLPGAEEYKGDYYPPPFQKKYSGSFKVGDRVIAQYKVTRGRNEITKGDGSEIKHVTYNSNPFAGLGTRPVLNIKEEAGEFPNLERAWNADMQSLMYDGIQFGTQIALGTGGNMKSGTVDLKRMFNEPENYNCVAFEDIYDLSRRKISMFFPYTMGLNKFKDELGNTKYDEALEYISAARKKLYDDGASKQIIEQELQFRPLKPSEAFLVTGGNIFPKDDLLAQKTLVETSEEIKNMSSVGRLEFNEAGNVEFVLDPKKREITKFPLDINDDTEGAIVIWEHPIENPPHGLYIAGADPYDHDKAGTGSLGSTMIYKRFFDAESTYDWPVAEYTGRPETADEYYENVRRLLIYYNARLLFENERKGIHQYFAYKDCTYLLLDQPLVLKDIIKNSTVDREKGTHMTTQIKDYAEGRIKTWLLEEFAPGQRNVKKIFSRALLQELIDYNDEGNFDRVIGFMCVMIFRDEVRKRLVSKKEDDNISNFFNIEHSYNKPIFY